MREYHTSSSQPLFHHVCIFVFIVSLSLALIISYGFSYVYAAEQEMHVYINEFVIEPDNQVELVNLGNEPVDISHWYLDDNGGSTKSYYEIPKGTIIAPQSCITVQSSKLSFNKGSKDSVRLLTVNPEHEEVDDEDIIDIYAYDGSPGEHVSFQRIPDGNSKWRIAPHTLRLWNGSKQSCLQPSPTSIPPFIPTQTPAVLPSLSPSPTITPTTMFTPTPTNNEPKLIHYDNIYIAEVMAAPESGMDEWVELYNNNDFTVHLEYWYIDDEADAGASPKRFSLEIEAQSYAVVEFTSALFNNSGDDVRLLDWEKNEIDVVRYTDTEKGYSLGRTSWNTNEICIQEASPNEANNSCMSMDDKDDTSSPSSRESKNSSKRKSSASSMRTHTYTPSMSSSAKSHVLGALSSSPFFPGTLWRYAPEASSEAVLHNETSSPLDYNTDSATPSSAIITQREGSMNQGVSVASLLYAITAIASIGIKMFLKS